MAKKTEAEASGVPKKARTPVHPLITRIKEVTSAVQRKQAAETAFAKAEARLERESNKLAGLINEAPEEHRASLQSIVTTARTAAGTVIETREPEGPATSPPPSTPAGEAAAILGTVVKKTGSEGGVSTRSSESGVPLAGRPMEKK